MRLDTRRFVLSTFKFKNFQGILIIPVVVWNQFVENHFTKKFFFFFLLYIIISSTDRTRLWPKWYEVITPEPLNITR